MRTPLLVFLVISGLGCDAGKLNLGGDDTAAGGEGGGGISPTGTLGQGAESRLIADLQTWGCWDPTSGREYLGAYAMNITLEYAPEGLDDLSLPASGECAGGLSLFPVDAGVDGADLPEDPWWVTDWDSGPFSWLGPGFYLAEVFGNQHTCQPSDELIDSGVAITRAGEVDGVSTPSSGALDGVSTGLGGGGLAWGETPIITWDAAGWQESWIQIRMERDGVAYDTVTCNTTGLERFPVNEAVWDKFLYFKEDTPVDVINLYVGFQNNGETEVASGLVVDVITRGVYLEVVQE